MERKHSGRRSVRRQPRCNATEELLRSGRELEDEVASPAALVDELGDLDPRELDAHLLRVGKELTGAMLALRPSTPDACPDPAHAYDRLHAAMNDLAGVYQYSQVRQMVLASGKPVEHERRRRSA